MRNYVLIFRETLECEFCLYYSIFKNHLHFYELEEYISFEYRRNFVIIRSFPFQDKTAILLS